MTPNKLPIDSSGKTSENSLVVGVEGDELVIRIGVKTLQFSFETGEDNQPFDEKVNDFRRAWKVTDPHHFAQAVGLALQAEEEDGSTPLTALFDAAFIVAIENDTGVDEDGRIVTAEMLKMTPDKLPESPAFTPGPWRRGQEGNLRIYGSDGQGPSSGLYEALQAVLSEPYTLTKLAIDKIRAALAKARGGDK